MERIPEADWKVMRELEAGLLERFCRGVLDEVATLAAEPPGGSHDAYLRLFRLIDERNGVMAEMFDGWSRSHAPMKLRRIFGFGLLRNEELARFTPATREWLNHAMR